MAATFNGYSWPHAKLIERQGVDMRKVLRADYDAYIEYDKTKTHTSNVNDSSMQKTNDTVSEQNTETGFGPAQFVNKKPIPQEPTISPLSYTALIRDFNRFRAVARSESDMYDMPGHVFFRIMFHFDNGSDAQEPEPGTEGRDNVSGIENAWTGLIAPSWYEFPDDFAYVVNDQSDIETLWRSSTAFNYFVLNGDITRAMQTKQFVELLSNISSNSPWYFQNIKGLDAAIERSVTAPGVEFQFKEERDKITIECLDDSYDQRIGTLLDLYRAIVWSWETKRQMLPANLRKFDMTIIAFQMPLRGKHISRNNLELGKVKEELVSDFPAGVSINKVVENNGVTNVYVSDSNEPVASFKAWEFHGCEIDYNSSKSGWVELDNAAGSAIKYGIDIYFDDVFETRFNEFIPATITDIVGDITSVTFDDSLNPSFTSDGLPAIPTPQPYTPPESKYESTHGPQSVGTNMHGLRPHNKSGLLDQIVGVGTEWAKTKLKKLYLGNLNGLSLKKIGQQINQALDGDVWGTAYNTVEYVRGNHKGDGATLGENIYPKPPKQDHIIELGNIFRANTTLNT